MTEKSLIKEHIVDAATGKLTLFMPNLEMGVAESVRQEIEHIAFNTPEIHLTFHYDSGHAKIEIEGDNTTRIALGATKVMTRKIAVLGEGESGEFRNYASRTDTESVLKSLKGVAERQNATHVITAIDKLLATVEKIYRG